MTFRRSLWFIICALLWLSFPAQSEAQSPIQAQVIAESSYPNGIIFRLNASSSAGNITDARLSLRTPGGKSRQNAPFRFQPAPTVEAEAQVGRQAGTLAPGALYEYQLRVRDSAGNELTSDPATFTYYPPDQDWQEITRGEATFVWYEGSEAWAEEMVALAAPAVQRAAEDYGVEVNVPVRIIAFPDTETLREALPNSPEWIGGITLADQGLTIQYISPDSDRRDWNEVVIPHEIAHLVFSLATPSTFAPIPNWMSEGLAMYNEPGDHAEDRASVEEAASEGRLYRLSELRSESFGDSHSVGLGYAMAWHFADFMVNDCGKDGLKALIAELNKGKSLDDSLTAACGYDEEGLYSRWYTSLMGEAPPASATDLTEPDTSDPSDSQDPATDDTQSEPFEPAEPSATPEQSGSGLPTFLGVLLLLGGLGLGFVALIGLVALAWAMSRA
jgi:hypothetical protein